MIRKLLATATIITGSALAIQAQDLVLSEGQYYTDETQTTPYTGRYTEFYDDGMLKMELYLKDGRRKVPMLSIIRTERLPRSAHTIMASSTGNGEHTMRPVSW